MDRAREYISNGTADIVILGNYTKPISQKNFQIICNSIMDIYNKTGLRCVITEFYADAELDTLITRTVNPKLSQFVKIL